MSVNKKYPEGLLGKKLGMTHLFADDGTCVPVTVIRLGPCYVLAVKELEQHGYAAVQLGFEPKKAQRLRRSEQGHCAQAGRGGFYFVRELRCDVAALGWGELGKELQAADVFADGDMVDVTGTSIGRGFAGVVRRYHMKGSPSTRGTHEVRRHTGSIGCRKTPGRVFKNQRMPGHMGAERVTVQNLRVIKVDSAENLLLVRGAVPGSKGAMVMVQKAAKSRGAAKEQAA